MVFYLILHFDTTTCTNISTVVCQSFSGEGLGGKLLRELIKHAKSDGLDAIEAVVMQTNRAMIHVAEKAGFEQIYDREEGLVKSFLDLTDRKSMTVEDMKRRRISAPICI